MKKSVLIYVKNKEALNNYKRMIENGKFDDLIPYSREVERMIKEFSESNYEIYLGTMENFDVDNNVFYDIYVVSKKVTRNMTIDNINDEISIMVIRNLGSVEANFVMIQKCINYLITNYKGKTINNLKSMLKGMTKNYLVEIDRNELSSIGMNTIPTQIFPNTVSFEEICSSYPQNREKYLIKPLTGELSNSLKCLSEIDEEFLRWKQDKVGGWVIQPIQEDIWNGEYQISFLNGVPIYAQQKSYPKDGNVPSQKNRIISKFHPTDKEISIMQNVIKYFSKLYDLNIILCRIDFMKDSNGTPKLLEFEMVNPGFFIGYMEENDNDIKRITEAIRKYCDIIISEE